MSLMAKVLLTGFLTARSAEVGPQEATQSLTDLRAYLAKHGKEGLTMPDPAGMRPVHWAASGGNMQVMQELVRQGADPWDGTATAEERNALHMACSSGHADMVKHLLTEPLLKVRSRGAFTKKQAADSRDKRQTPCVHLAALAGHEDVLTVLAQAGADLQAETERSGTPLHAAAAVGQQAVVEILVKQGADPCAKNAKGKTPRQRAEDEDMDEVVPVLKQAEAAKGCAPAKKEKKDTKNKMKTVTKKEL
ncbi:unnamed protein product [Prorocentrum cordatum]|uniref:Uncharacterized protein n=1 Tax=Prorocentrum cordatum TaxID=2364126 RepID=A0ABN9TPL3_9DINO|nr:unnamed protein product [Polarella glacialis]|mmetsp:Transcript_63363/g.170924  ORF Transcript_63363/g.170924 Transcript_63363/m.170924 type:complete len:249 (-) Transcript_63363:83-829(-)